MKPCYATAGQAGEGPAHLRTGISHFHDVYKEPEPGKDTDVPDLTESADRKLVLLRHAKSAWPDVPDHERQLARRGRRNAPAMGRWLRAAGHVPDQVVCSTARRARETWQLAQGGLGAAPPVSFEDRVYEASAGQLLDLIHGAPPGARTLLIVGHDPGIPGLALMLAGNPPPASSDPADGAVPQAAVDRMRAKFPTAAVAVLEITGSWGQLGPRTARLACFVTPREIESTGDAAANDQ